MKGQVSLSTKKKTKSNENISKDHQKIFLI
jgi:hypothetical protein